MKRSQFGKAVLASALLALVFMSPAYAQATRTWVSGVGDDANPCSRTAPCKTFAAALSKDVARNEINYYLPHAHAPKTTKKTRGINYYASVGRDLDAGAN